MIKTNYPEILETIDPSDYDEFVDIVDNGFFLPRQEAALYFLIRYGRIRITDAAFIALNRFQAVESGNLLYGGRRWGMHYRPTSTRLYQPESLKRAGGWPRLNQLQCLGMAESLLSESGLEVLGVLRQIEDGIIFQVRKRHGDEFLVCAKEKGWRLRFFLNCDGFLCD